MNGVLLMIGEYFQVLSYNFVVNYGINLAAVVLVIGTYSEVYFPVQYIDLICQRDKIYCYVYLKM